MNPRDRIQQDLTAAMKARDQVTTRVLRSLLSAIGNAEAVEMGEEPKAATLDAYSADVARRQLTDDDVARIVVAEIAERREAIDTYLRIDRSDLAEAMEAEIEVLGRFVPI